MLNKDDGHTRDACSVLPARKDMLWPSQVTQNQTPGAMSTGLKHQPSVVASGLHTNVQTPNGVLGGLPGKPPFLYVHTYLLPRLLQCFNLGSMTSSTKRRATQYP